MHKQLARTDLDQCLDEVEAEGPPTVAEADIMRAWIKAQLDLASDAATDRLGIKFLYAALQQQQGP